MNGYVWKTKTAKKGGFKLYLKIENKLFQKHYDYLQAKTTYWRCMGHKNGNMKYKKLLFDNAKKNVQRLRSTSEY